MKIESEKERQARSLREYNLYEIVRDFIFREDGGYEIDWVLPDGCNSRYRSMLLPCLNYIRVNGHQLSILEVGQTAPNFGEMNPDFYVWVNLEQKKVEEIKTVKGKKVEDRKFFEIIFKDNFERPFVEVLDERKNHPVFSEEVAKRMLKAKKIVK